MRPVLLLAALLISLASCGQNKSTVQSAVPADVLTNDSTYWTVSTLSNLQYVNTTPGAYYNTTKNGGGMIVKFKFLPGGKYEFMLYVQVNTYGLETESWTHAEGKVEFTKNEKGQAIFKTFPTKGTYRYSKNGQVTNRAATKEELKNSQLRTYLWERWENPQDQQNDYLLVVDLTANPGADPDKPETLTADMISKFHIPKAKK
ncbi:MAG: hypothetical protein KA821_14920 [Chitinophagaceae bacterium]|nr:hypothetical protein [Chitinophagaceae bacterium]